MHGSIINLDDVSFGDKEGIIARRSTTKRKDGGGKALALVECCYSPYAVSYGKAKGQPKSGTAKKSKGRHCWLMGDKIDSTHFLSAYSLHICRISKARK